MMNGKVRAFNGDMGMAMSVFKDMVGKVRFVFADPPYKITQARYDKEGFDYKAMWEVIQKMLCPYGVVAVTCSLTAAVEIMRVAPARQGEIWTDERSAHDEEYFSVEDHNSAIVLPRGTIYKLAGRHLTWEDDPISLKSVIEELPHELRKMNMIKHKV